MTMHLRLLLVTLLAFVSLSEKCYVEQTGYEDFCSNGEICTRWGCRCMPNTACHHANDNRTYCGALNTCSLPDGTQQCCRTGEQCVANVGCRCGPKMCQPYVCEGECLQSAKDSLMTKTMKLKLEHSVECWRSGECQRIQREAKPTSGEAVPCVDGMAGGYPCQNVDMLAQLNFNQLGCANNPYFTGSNGNDIWGWSKNGRHFAIVGCTTGTSFVEITDPTKPVVIGWLKTPSSASTWRDMKIYKDFVFIVTEAKNSGMQVFDLTKLLTQTNPGPGNELFVDNWFIDGMGTINQRSTHNIAIDEYTGRAFLVGCQTCAGGLLIVDITTPKNPTLVGCFYQDGYTHDAHCVYYASEMNYPDRRFYNREICFAFNEDTFTIVDTTDPETPLMISRTQYYGNSYCHQGWASANMRWVAMDDELDEFYRTYDASQRTVTYIWDISNLAEPLNVKQFISPEVAIDHNQYIVGNCDYQSNYAAGLRILKLGNLGQPGEEPTQVGYFDVDPDPTHLADFWGSWSVFADFPGSAKDIVVANSIERGLFVLRVDKKALGCESL